MLHSKSLYGTLYIGTNPSHPPSILSLAWPMERRQMSAAALTHCVDTDESALALMTSSVDEY